MARLARVPGADRSGPLRGVGRLVVHAHEGLRHGELGACCISQTVMMWLGYYAVEGQRHLYWLVTRTWSTPFAYSLEKTRRGGLVVQTYACCRYIVVMDHLSQKEPVTSTRIQITQSWLSIRSIT